MLPCRVHHFLLGVIERLGETTIAKVIERWVMTKESVHRSPRFNFAECTKSYNLEQSILGCARLIVVADFADHVL